MKSSFTSNNKLKTSTGSRSTSKDLKKSTSRIPSKTATNFSNVNKKMNIIATPVSEYIEELINKAVDIGEFKNVHKINQEAFENRKVTKELNYVSIDYQMDFPSQAPLVNSNNNQANYNNNHFEYPFTSPLLKEFLLFNSKGLITKVDLITQQKEMISIWNVNETPLTILDVEFNTATNEFLILYSNLTFNKFNILKYETLKSRYLSLKNTKNNNKEDCSMFHCLLQSKSQYFNFKEVINNFNERKFRENVLNAYTTKQSNDNSKLRKLISWFEYNPQSLILNFSSFSNRIVIFNLELMTITKSLIISPLLFLNISSSKVVSDYKFIVNMLLNSELSLSQYERIVLFIREKLSFKYTYETEDNKHNENANLQLQCQISEKICDILSNNSNKIIKDNLRYLFSSLIKLSFDMFVDMILKFEFFLTKLYYYSKCLEENLRPGKTIRHEFQLENEQKLKDKISYNTKNNNNKSNSKYDVSNINIESNVSLLSKIDKDLKKQHINCLDNTSNSDIGSKNKNDKTIYDVLFLCFKRNINFEEVIKETDQDKKQLLNKKTFILLLKSLPIGLTEDECQDIVLNQLPTDEYNNIIYDYIFEEEEYFILKTLFIKHNKNSSSSDNNQIKNPSNYGYFKKQEYYSSRFKPFFKESRSFCPAVLNISNLGFNNSNTTLIGIYDNKIREKRFNKIINNNDNNNDNSNTTATSLFKSFMNFNSLTNKSTSSIFSNKFIDYCGENENIVNMFGLSFEIGSFIFIEKLSIFFITEKNENNPLVFICKVNNSYMIDNSITSIQNCNSNSNTMNNGNGKSLLNLNSSFYSTKLELLGCIKTNSILNLNFLHYIPEKNLLITQKKKISNKEEYFKLKEIAILSGNDIIDNNEFDEKSVNNKAFDLVLIDIYKHIFDKFQSNYPWEVTEFYVVKDFSETCIQEFFYLQRTKLFYFRTMTDIIIVNPRSHYLNLSFQYKLNDNIDSIKNIYDDICREICENPVEYAGSPMFKEVTRIAINSAKNTNNNKDNNNFANSDSKTMISPLCLNLSNLDKYSNNKTKQTKLTRFPSDLIIIFSQNNNTNNITMLGVLNLFIDVVIKSYDNPIPNIEKLFDYAQKQKIKNFIQEKNNIIANIINNSSNVYSKDKLFNKTSIKKLIFNNLSKELINNFVSDLLNYYHLQSISQRNSVNSTALQLQSLNINSSCNNNMIKDSEIDSADHNNLHYHNDMNLDNEDNNTSLLEFSFIEKLFKEYLLIGSKNDINDLITVYFFNNREKERSDYNKNSKNTNNYVNMPNSPLSKYTSLTSNELKSVIILSEIFSQLSLNPLALFKTFSNNSIEFISLSKSNFINLLSSKISLLKSSLMETQNKNKYETVSSKNSSNMRYLTSSMNIETYGNHFKTILSEHCDNTKDGLSSLEDKCAELVNYLPSIITVDYIVSLLFDDSVIEMYEKKGVKEVIGINEFYSKKLDFKSNENNHNKYNYSNNEDYTIDVLYRNSSKNLEIRNLKQYDNNDINSFNDDNGFDNQNHTELNFSTNVLLKNLLISIRNVKEGIKKKNILRKGYLENNSFPYYLSTKLKSNNSNINDKVVSATNNESKVNNANINANANTNNIKLTTSSGITPFSEFIRKLAAYFKKTKTKTENSFDLLSIDKMNILSISEFKAGILKLIPEMKEIEMQYAIDVLDMNKTNTISDDEWNILIEDKVIPMMEHISNNNTSIPNLNNSVKSKNNNNENTHQSRTIEEIILKFSDQIINFSISEIKLTKEKFELQSTVKSNNTNNTNTANKDNISNNNNSSQSQEFNNLTNNISQIQKDHQEYLDEKNLEEKNNCIYDLFKFFEINNIRNETSFKVFDKHNSGVIFKNQFKHHLKNFGSEEEIKKIFNYFDYTERGYIYENEYYRLIKEVLYDPKINNKKLKKKSTIKFVLTSNTLGKDPDFNKEEYEYSNEDFILVIVLFINKIIKFVKDKSSFNLEAIYNWKLFELFSEGLGFVSSSKFFSKVINYLGVNTSFELSVIKLFLGIYNCDIIYKEDFDKKATNIVREFLVSYYKDYGLSSLPMLMSKTGLYSNANNTNIPNNTVNSNSNIKVNLHKTLPTLGLNQLIKEAVPQSTLNISNNKNKDLFKLLKSIQNELLNLGKSPQEIFYSLDSKKHGFLTFNDTLLNLPLIYKVNLTINQHIVFFEYLDRNKDGLVSYDDFKQFYGTEFSKMIFDSLSTDFNDLVDTIQEEFIQFCLKTNTDIKCFLPKNIINIRQLKEFFDSVLMRNKSGGVSVVSNNEVDNKYNNSIGVEGLSGNNVSSKTSENDFFVLFDILNNKSNSNSLSNKSKFVFTLRDLILTLEKTGVNTLTLTDYSSINEVVDNDIITLFSKFESIRYVLTEDYIMFNPNSNSSGYSNDTNSNKLNNKLSNKNILVSKKFNYEYDCFFSYFSLFDKNSDGFLTYNEFYTSIVNVLMFDSSESILFNTINKSKILNSINVNQNTSTININNNKINEVNVNNITTSNKYCFNIDLKTTNDKNNNNDNDIAKHTNALINIIATSLTERFVGGSDNYPSTIITKSQIEKKNNKNNYEEKKPTNISISELSMLLNYLKNVYNKKLILKKPSLSVSHINQLVVNSKLNINNLIMNASKLNSLSNKYYKLIQTADFSGLIIHSKFLEDFAFINQSENIIKTLDTYIGMLSKHGYNILSNSFLKRIKHVVLRNKDTIDFNKIDLPFVKLVLFDDKDFISKTKIGTNLGESFVVYNTQMERNVRVFKFLRSFLVRVISSDNQSLLKHIEYSLKVQHLLINASGGNGFKDNNSGINVFNNNGNISNVLQSSNINNYNSNNNKDANNDSNNINQLLNSIENFNKKVIGKNNNQEYLYESFEVNNPNISNNNNYNSSNINNIQEINIISKHNFHSIKPPNNKIQYSKQLNQLDANNQSILNSFPAYPFEDYFFSNIGTFDKKVMLNHKQEEELFFINEKINKEEYICLEEVVKSNGGLLNIPELYETDLVFYIIRFWGLKFLTIFTTLHQQGVCLKYLQLKDFFISKDGLNIRIKPLMHLSFYDKDNGKVFSGPDLEVISIFYPEKTYFFENNIKDEQENKEYDTSKYIDNNNNNINNNEEDVDKKDVYDKNQEKYLFFDDPFIAPEFILDYKNKDSFYKDVDIKVDSWLFGTFLFTVLFGEKPVSYISQLKQWINNHTNLKFEKIVFPYDITNSSFNYEPFNASYGFNLNIEDKNHCDSLDTYYTEETSNVGFSCFSKFNKNSYLENLINVLANKSFSSVISKKYKESSECGSDYINDDVHNTNKVKFNLKENKTNNNSTVINDSNKAKNNESLNKSKINGLGLILDLISSCLSPEPKNRPDLIDLIHSDLFKFDKIETALVQKFSFNALQYFAPEHVIIKQILLPLRQISAKVIQDESTIFDYENFLQHILHRLDYFFFDDDFNSSSKKTNSENKSTYNNKLNNDYNNTDYTETSSVNTNKINQKINQNKFNSNNNKPNENLIDDLNRKNSQIVKCVIDSKIIDILIFLSLRHFNLKLESFKKYWHSKLNKELLHIKDKKTELELKRQQAEGVRTEMEVNCGQLISLLIKFIEKCVWSLTGNQHMISVYVENVIEWILKLYIGEDYSFLSMQLDPKLLKNNSNYKHLLYENLSAELLKKNEINYYNREFDNKETNVINKEDKNHKADIEISIKEFGNIANNISNTEKIGKDKNYYKELYRENKDNEDFINNTKTISKFFNKNNEENNDCLADNENEQYNKNKDNSKNPTLDDIIESKIRNNPEAIKANILRYLDLRTFMRTPQMINKEFKEDEADKTWVMNNNNIDLCFKKTFWSPELHYLVSPLYKLAITESGNGNFKFPVIKNFFLNENESELSINPFINKNLKKYITLNSIKNVLTINYVNELFSLSECNLNLSSSTDNLSSKRAALSYFSTIFKSKNLDKIRACFDFKIHLFIVKFLNSNNQLLRNEALSIFKEISFAIIDLDELNWLFGNNYNSIFDSIINNKSEPINHGDFSRNQDWGRNFSLVQFLNSSLNSDHSYVLLFAEKFLGQSRDSSFIYINEMSKILTSPLYLKPILRALGKNSETIQTRQLCLEVLFNIILSNNETLIYSLNSTLCNFYETIIKIISQFNVVNTNLNNYNLDTADNLPQKQISFNNSLKQVVSILIRLQNPLIKEQIFKSKALLKFLNLTDISFITKYEFDDIEKYLFSIKHLVNFSKEYDKLNTVIDSFKAWIQYYYLDSKITVKMYYGKIKNIISVLVKVLNIEWKEGMNSFDTNCLVFNIIKLFEWLCKKDLQELLFKGNESISIVISLMTKIKDVYNNIVVNEMSLVNLRNDDKMVTKGSIGILSQKKKNQNVKQKNNVNQITKKESYSTYNTNNNYGNNYSNLGNYENNSTENTNNNFTFNPNNKNNNSNNNISKNQSQVKIVSLIKVYHLNAIKMLQIILSIFNKNISEYNDLLEKSRFGMLLADVFYSQYALINKYFDNKIADINILNVSLYIKFITRFNIKIELHTRK